MNFNLKHLINIGSHLGHNKKFRKQLNSNFILGTKKNIDIIDVNQTLIALQKATNIIIETIFNNGKILIISNNTYLTETVKKEFPIYLQPTIIGSWIPGSLSNFYQINKNIKHKLINTSHFGINSLNRPPSLIILLNKDNNQFILQEAKKLQIPVIAITDTNTHLNGIQYPIPSNDDSIELQSFFFSLIKKSILTGYAKKLLFF